MGNVMFLMFWDVVCCLFNMFEVFGEVGDY